MGCDIHDYVEVHQPSGAWVKVGAVFPNPYFDSKKPPGRRLCWVSNPPSSSKPQFIANYHPDYGLDCNDQCFLGNERLIDHPFHVRDYNVFALLADVRNSDGREITPITTPPLGLPDDMSSEVATLADSWGEDGHSHSYLDLHTLLAYDWRQVTNHSGMVEPAQYRRYKKEGAPTSWFQACSRLRKVSNKQMDELLLSKEDRPADFRDCYTHIKWQRTAAQAAGRLWTVTIPELVKLLVPEQHQHHLSRVNNFVDAAREGDTDSASVLDDYLEENGLLTTRDVRMVFWFDN